jgi:two-component system response regulator PilR (NtrC family)
MPIDISGKEGFMLTRNILIVDDNPNMSTLLSDILEIFDFKGNYAGDGDEALDKLRKEKFDLVFTDLRMPKMGGMDLLKAIKAEHPEMPVVVVTGYSEAETRNEVLSEKADGFLSKPFRVNDIQTLLTSLLGQPD